MLADYVTFQSILRNDVISLSTPLLADQDKTILDMTPDENVFSEDDLIDLIDKTKKFALIKTVIKGLTKKESIIIAMRFGFGPLVQQ
jgi:DNA-directed RNA polymerase sigma subunit (sigma70/sigma32)